MRRPIAALAAAFDIAEFERVHRALKGGRVVKDEGAPGSRAAR